MSHLFSPFTLKGVTLRNRITMSPMTMYRSVDGKLDGYHVSYLGARAAGGFGLVFPEQIAITPEGRTTVSCAGIYDESQLEGLERVCSIIKSMGGVAAIQLGNTGRKGSLVTPWEGRSASPSRRAGTSASPRAPPRWSRRRCSTSSCSAARPHQPAPAGVGGPGARLRQPVRSRARRLGPLAAQLPRYQDSVGFPAVEQALAGAPVANATPTAGFRVDDLGVDAEAQDDQVPELKSA